MCAERQELRTALNDKSRWGNRSYMLGGGGGMIGTKVDRRRGIDVDTTVGNNDGYPQYDRVIKVYEQVI